MKSRFDYPLPSCRCSSGERFLVVFGSTAPSIYSRAVLSRYSAFGTTHWYNAAILPHVLFCNRCPQHNFVKRSAKTFLRRLNARWQSKIEIVECPSSSLWPARVWVSSVVGPSKQKHKVKSYGPYIFVTGLGIVAFNTTFWQPLELRELLSRTWSSSPVLLRILLTSTLMADASVSALRL